MENTKRRFLVTIVCALILFALANVLTNIYRDKNWANRYLGLVRWKWNLVLREKEPSPVLIFGDSIGLAGVDPEIILERTQQQALNLSVYSTAGMVQAVWMLEAYAKRFPPPRVVILAYGWDTLAEEDFNLEWSNIPLPTAQWLRLSPSPFFNPLRRPVDFIEMLLFRFVPLYSTNPVKSFMSSRRGSATIGRFVGQRGFEGLVPHMGAEAKLLIEPGSVEKLRRPPTLSNMNRRVFAQFRAFAAQHGTRFLLIDPPTPASLSAINEWGTYRSGIQSLLEREMSNGVIFIKGPIIFDDKYFVDVDHLTADGAQKFTGLLVETIAPYLNQNLK